MIGSSNKAEQGENHMNTPKKDKKRLDLKKIGIMALIFPAVLLIASIIGISRFTEKSHTTLSELNPFGKRGVTTTV